MIERMETVHLHRLCSDLSRAAAHANHRNPGKGERRVGKPKGKTRKGELWKRCEGLDDMGLHTHIRNGVFYHIAY